MHKVLNGIDRSEALDQELKGLRLGVVTGGGAINRELTPVVDVLCQRYKFTFY